MYIFLLGYDVDFGHLEALKLLADPKFCKHTPPWLVCALRCVRACVVRPG